MGARNVADILTMQDLANGHLDVKALGEAANGDENTIVTTRTGNTYPSAERAINIMFKNGGLPAEPFATKALMTASALIDGKYAQVTDDTVNNGLYVKAAGAWVKSAYDPVEQSKGFVNLNPLFNPQNIADSTDFNSYKRLGVYTRFGGGYTNILNAPYYRDSGIVAYGVLVVQSPASYATNAIHQTFYPEDGLPVVTRQTNADGVFSEWSALLTRANQHKQINLQEGQDVLALGVGDYNIETRELGETLVNMPVVLRPLGSIKVRATTRTHKEVIFTPYGQELGFYTNKTKEGGWSGWYKTSDDATLLAQSSVFTPEIVLPPKIYTESGLQTHIYKETLTPESSDLYLHKVTCGRGKHVNSGWVYDVPDGLTASSTPLTWSLHNKGTGDLLVSKSTTIVTANSAKSGTKKVMAIGDSYINAAVITQRLLDISVNNTFKTTLLGTRGDGLNKHEGRGGWTVANYTTSGATYYKFTVNDIINKPLFASRTYTYNSSEYLLEGMNVSGSTGTVTMRLMSGTAPSLGAVGGVLTRLYSGTADNTLSFSAITAVNANPFWYDDAVNFGQYLTSNSLSAPDFVMINLGVNDCFGMESDNAVEVLTVTAFAQLDTLITSIKSANPAVKIGLMTAPTYADQDAFGNDYGSNYTSWRTSRNIVIWAKKLYERYTASEANNIYIVASGLSVDTVNNMPTTTQAINSHNPTLVTRQSNSVHPDVSGYKQIGDSIFAWIKAI